MSCHATVVKLWGIFGVATYVHKMGNTCLQEPCCDHEQLLRLLPKESARKTFIQKLSIIPALTQLGLVACAFIPHSLTLPKQDVQRVSSGCIWKTVSCYLRHCQITLLRNDRDAGVLKMPCKASLGVQRFMHCCLAKRHSPYGKLAAEMHVTLPSLLCQAACQGSSIELCKTPGCKAGGAPAGTQAIEPHHDCSHQSWMLVPRLALLPTDNSH